MNSVLCTATPPGRRHAIASYEAHAVRPSPSIRDRACGPVPPCADRRDAGPIATRRRDRRESGGSHSVEPRAPPPAVADARERWAEKYRIATAAAKHSAASRRALRTSGCRHERLTEKTFRSPERRHLGCFARRDACVVDAGRSPAKVCAWCRRRATWHPPAPEGRAPLGQSEQPG